MGKARMKLVTVAGLSLASVSAISAAHVWNSARQVAGPTSANVVAPPPAAAPLVPIAAPPAVSLAPLATDRLTPTFDLVRVEATGDAVVAGQSGPGWRVELLANGELLGSALANASGEWAIVPGRALTTADQLLTLRATSPDRVRVVASAQSIVVGNVGRGEKPIVLLNEPAKATAVLQTPDPLPAPASASATAKDGPSTTVAAIPAALDVAASEPPSMPALPAPAPVLAPVLAIEALTYEGGKLMMTGKAGAGVTLRVYLNDTFVKDVVASGEQRFEAVLDALLPAGHYRVRVDAVGMGAGLVAARVEVPFEREAEPKIASLEPAPTSDISLPLPGIGGGLGAGVLASSASSVDEPRVVIIKRGDNLWRVSHKSYGDPYRYTTIYQANRSQIRDPNKIFPGQIFVMPLAGPGRG